MSSKSIRKIVYKTPEGLVETQYHSLYTDLTKLREEVQRLGVLEDRLNVKVVKILPETLEDNVLYVVSDENVVDVKSILSRLSGHDLDIQVINSDLEQLNTDLDTTKAEINARIDDTSEVIGLKTTELNTKLDTMQADIDEFKEKMNEQKTDFTANIVQLQDLTAKHTNDIKTNADDIDALETALEEHKTANTTDIARIDAKDVEQDALLAELTGQGSGLSILDLKDTVQNNSDRIQSLETHEEDHEERISTLETSTANYQNANNKRVQDLETLVDTKDTAVNERIDTLDNKVNTNRTEFLNYQTLLNNDLNTRFTAHDERITQNTNDIADIREDMEAGAAETAKALQDAIDEEARTRAQADTNLQDSVNIINNTDKDQNARIKALETYTQNDFTQEIQNLKDRATALENADVSLARKVQAIQQFSANHDSRLENLELNDHSYYNQRITALENTTANQKNRLDGIDTLNTTQNNRLTAVETKNAEQDDTLGVHDERITDLEEHRENLEAESRQIARDELDTKLQELEDNYHDEMMQKVEGMTTDRLDELSTDYNNFKDTVENDIDTFKTQTNNSIQTFQGTLDTTLELVEDTQTEIKNTQTEQKAFLEEKTQAITDAQLVQDHYNQSYWEKFLQADEYNKELAEQQRLDKVNVYATNPNFSEEVVDTVTEYETVQEEIPEDERDPEHPEITTRELQKEVQREVTHTVQHSQLNNSVALYENTENDPESEDYTQYDYATLQAKIEALEATKDDYISDIEDVNARISEMENYDDEIETLSNKIDATKTQVQGIGRLHAQTQERVYNLEGFRDNHTQAFNNYKTQQSKINNDQNDDLQSIHDYLDLNVQDMVDNYDKLQTQNQDDVVVLRKVVDTPATDDTEETSHLELDSTEIIKVDDLVDTKEELLRVRDLPVKDHKETYLRGEKSDGLYAVDNTVININVDAMLMTKETYYDFNLDVEDAKNVIVSKSDNGLQRLEVRKTIVQETHEIPSEVEGEDPTTETVNVPKYTLWYVQTDEYINEDTQETYTEDTEIKITDIDPEDYEDILEDQNQVYRYGKWDIHFAFSDPSALWSGSGDLLSHVRLYGNSGALAQLKSTSQNDNTKYVGQITCGSRNSTITLTADSAYSEAYKVSKSWQDGPNFDAYYPWLSGAGTGHSVRYVIDDISLEKLVFENTEEPHHTYFNKNIKVTIKYNNNVLLEKDISLSQRSRVTIDVLNGFKVNVEGV